MRLFVLTLALTVLGTPTRSAEARKIRMGYFEGGKYAYHDRLRDEFLKQLNAILPDSLEAVFAPEGYRTAAWDKDSCGLEAKELADVKTIDLVVAMGPWVVRDLLAAGFKRPIVAMHQFAPQFEGLLDSKGRPVAKNLTIQTDKSKLERDLNRLASLVKLKRLGLLYFPSSIEADSVLASVKAIGAKLGFEVVTADGVNSKGTYAYFNAYNALDKKIDALYVTPMWGLEIQMINQFFYNTDHDKIPVMSSEDKFLVDRGAFASNAAYCIFSEARFNAYKAAQIILGAKPGDLQVEFPLGTALTVNEGTAQRCRIQLERRVYNEADVVLAPPSDETPQLTLSEALARAIGFNPGFLAQHDAVAAAAQAASQAYSTYLPQIDASTALGHRDDDYVNNSRRELKKDYYVTRLNFRQKVFSLETIKSIQIAAKERDLKRLTEEQARVGLEQAVTKAFLNNMQAQEVLNQQIRIRALIDRNIEITGAKFMAEHSDEYDFSRWRSEREEATQGIIDARKNLEVAQILLNTLLNYPPEQPLNLKDEKFTSAGTQAYYVRIYDRLANENAVNSISLALINQTAANSPNLQMSEEKLQIQNIRLAQNKSRYWPTLDFGATYQYADELNDTPPPFKEERDSWTIGGILNFPIFLGTDRIHERRKLKAELNQFEYERDNQKLAVSGKVQSAFRQMISDFDDLPVAARRLEQSRINLEQVVQRYDAGELSLVNLLNEIDEITDAELDEIAVRYDFYRNMSDIFHEMGWSSYESTTPLTEKMEQLINKR